MGAAAFFVSSYMWPHEQRFSPGIENIPNMEDGLVAGTEQLRMAAGLRRAFREYAHESSDDLAKDQRRLCCGRVYAHPQPRNVDTFGDHVDGHDPGIG